MAFGQAGGEAVNFLTDALAGCPICSLSLGLAEGLGVA
jgi:hypothetical protein